jgi:hypothetical protein
MHYQKLYLHERNCGAVTEVCSKCNLRVPRSTLSEHETNCTATPAPSYSEDYSTPYFNSYSSRYKPYRRPSRPPTDGMICQYCQQVQSTYEELQIHVFTQHVDGVNNTNLYDAPEKTQLDQSDSDSESSIEDETKTEDSSRPSEEQPSHLPVKPPEEEKNNNGGGDPIEN